MAVSLQRCFVALMPERDTLDALDAWCTPLRDRHIRDMRWVSREHIHLTIRFIGALTPHAFEALVHNWATLGARLGAMPTRGVTLLPSARRPRVLAVELIASPELVALVGCVDALLDRAGAGYEKRLFRPHLSVARFRDARDGGQGHAGDFETVRPAPALMRFEALQLLSSTLTPQGAQYATVASIPVAASGSLT
jgi:RNA 2',3'-cyclic 3'-phosphodiesterase